jgi:hypothetical protein
MHKFIHFWSTVIFFFVFTLLFWQYSRNYAVTTQCLIVNDTWPCIKYRNTDEDRKLLKTALDSAKKNETSIPEIVTYINYWIRQIELNDANQTMESILRQKIMEAYIIDNSYASLSIEELEKKIIKTNWLMIIGYILLSSVLFVIKWTFSNNKIRHKDPLFRVSNKFGLYFTAAMLLYYGIYCLIIFSGYELNYFIDIILTAGFIGALWKITLDYYEKLHEP